MCSIAKSPRSSFSTSTTSTRTSSNRTPLASTQRTASRRSRLRFFLVTASSGVPYLVPERVFTSQATRARRSAATMSISPSEHRQLRASIRNPARCRYSAASCSPCWPRASLAFTLTTSAPDGGGNGGSAAEGRRRLWKEREARPRDVDGRTGLSARHDLMPVRPRPEPGPPSGEALLLVVWVGELKVALGEFLDVDVLEGDDPDVLHKSRWAVHVPHPGILHG